MMTPTNPKSTDPGPESPRPVPPSAKESLAREVSRLRRLTVAELVPVYEGLHGAAPRSRNRDWLWRRCAWKVQERALGGLSETAKRRLDELVDLIEIPDRNVVRTVAGRLDGRPTRSRAGRPAAEHASDLSPAGSPRPRPRPDLPPPGTTIVREWRGRELRLTFLDEGVDVDCAFHPSLTAAARAITGSKWNGRLFWLGRDPGR